MKRILWLFILLTFTLLKIPQSEGFNSGSTGADGAFNPTANTVLQTPADGIFNFTTINIPTGVKVTFIKNASNTPVYILATGDVNVLGTISVDGGLCNMTTPGVGGPGAFDGGLRGTPAVSGGAGQGPGGGNPGIGAVDGNINYGGFGGGGGFGTKGANGPYGGSSQSASGTGGSTYGNNQIIPMIGGS